jgi:AraC-like DNA-binding protein
VLFSFEGSCPFGFKHEVVQIRSQSVLFVEKLQYHALFYPEGTPDITHLWVTFAETEHRVFPSMVCVRNGRPKAFHLPRPRLLEEPYHRFIEKWDTAEADADNSDYNAEHLKVLAVDVAMDLLDRARHDDQPDGSPDAVVRTVKTFIDTHPEHTLDLEELAEISGYSKYHFHRMFRELTGETPHAYTTRRRVAHAHQLLAYGYSCHAVAEDLGFGSLAAFSRWFKDNTGTSPSKAQCPQDT